MKENIIFDKVDAGVADGVYSTLANSQYWNIQEVYKISAISFLLRGTSIVCPAFKKAAKQTSLLLSAIETGELGEVAKRLKSIDNLSSKTGISILLRHMVVRILEKNGKFAYEAYKKGFVCKHTTYKNLYVVPCLENTCFGGYELDIQIAKQNKTQLCLVAE